PRYQYLFSLALLYPAQASEAGPPGPGKISSSFVSVSGGIGISSARRDSSSCCVVRGPTIGAVTTGFASSHASATCAGCSPNCSQKPSYASNFAWFFSTASCVLELARRPCCTLRNAPPSSPPPSGLHGITPSPYA